VKTKTEAAFAQMATTSDAKFATIQGHLDALKAELTPAEYLLSILQAQAAEGAVTQAVTAAQANRGAQ
jgi:hypothetical protein